ncbi:MAG: lytic transglycosylase domain-containing protein [Gammaproteobacteria bacterium]|nr:lytic transglycosylase domain-containing protein [Gammaproteobacteria bacterium]
MPGLLLTSVLLNACSDSAETGGRSARHPTARMPDAALQRDAASMTTLNPSAGVPAAAVRPVVSAQQRRLTPLIDAIALSEGVEPTLVYAVISQESGYNPRAGSPAGALGLMQLMPATAARYGLTPNDRYDPAKNVRAGIRYLKFLSRQFNGQLDLILAGYNAGEGAVQKYGNRIPPYRETQDYVRKVKGYLALYRQRRRHRAVGTVATAAIQAPWRRLQGGVRQNEDLARDDARSRSTGY